MQRRVLVIDSDPATASLVASLPAVDVIHAVDLASAAAILVRGVSIDIVLLDAELAQQAGAGIGWRNFAPQARTLLLLAAAAPDLPAELLAMVDDFIARPLSAEELGRRIEWWLRSREPIADRNDAVLESPRRPRKSDVLVGTGPWLKELYDRITMVASTDVTVSITGESGTGKELVARTIHNLSRRRGSPFVVVNCAAIPDNLLEDELFGHIRGAFTDASRDREGLFGAADGGTIFLDEIGEVALTVQAKLLRVLQFQEFRPVGADVDRRVDVRVITATHRDLSRAVAAGTFREDLYYRIAVFPVHLPPLRDRREDLPLLAQHIVTRLRARLARSIDGVTPAALLRLTSYDFPGNVRELENVLHQAMVIARGPMIEAEDLALPVLLGEPRSPAAQHFDLSRSFRDLKLEAVAEFERNYVVELLISHRGNLAAAARTAGIDRKNLWAMTKKYGLDPAAHRELPVRGPKSH